MRLIWMCINTSVSKASLHYAWGISSDAFQRRRNACNWRRIRSCSAKIHKSYTGAKKDNVKRDCRCIFYSEKQTTTKLTRLHQHRLQRHCAFSKSIFLAFRLNSDDKKISLIVFGLKCNTSLWNEFNARSANQKCKPRLQINTRPANPRYDKSLNKRWMQHSAIKRDVNMPYLKLVSIIDWTRMGQYQYTL